MAKIHALILKICLGVFAATNIVACIFTTDWRVLVPLNLLVALACLGMVLFIESRLALLAKDLGISREEARQLARDYFNHYKNVERISVYEYYQKVSTGTGP